MIKKAIFIFLFISSGIFYYLLTEDKDASLDVVVIRVIDGDTLETDIGRVRLKGINTPEKGIPFYDEALNFLKRLENENVLLKSYGYDKYGRILAYVFYNGKNVNEEILKEGLGSLYYYGKDSFYEGLKGAEEFARLNEIGIWKKSSGFSCIELLELVYFEGGKRCSNKEQIKIRNSCNKEFSVLIKDDATHIYREKISANSVFLKNFSCIWNDEGDSVYVGRQRSFDFLQILKMPFKI